jgi:hypothetical protein
MWPQKEYGCECFQKFNECAQTNSKLILCKQLNQAVISFNKIISATIIKRKYFTFVEPRNLLNSNYYSILFHNSEIQNSPSLKHQCKQTLLSAQGRAFTIQIPAFLLLNYKNWEKVIQKIMGEYNCIRLLISDIDWQKFNWSQTNSTQQTTFGVLRSNNYRVGLNCKAHQFHILNEKISLDWLNKPLTAIKMEFKEFIYNVIILFKLHSL